jgi:ABC-type glycerol-3-phosphate transport system substrate-binding protein
VKKIKKAMALSLAIAMGLSLVACGSESTDDTTTTAATEDNSASADDTSADDTAADDTAADDTASDSEATASTGIAAPDTSDWDDSKKIYAYSWDEDFSKKLGVVLDAYPEYKDYVEFVTLGVGGTSDDYKTAIDTALESADEYPSLIPADNDVAKYWSEDDSKTLDLYSIGFTDDMLSNAYDYALQYGTTNGELKAVTWQACPGSVFYRRDIANEVFGTDDPDEIQNYLKDWDTFFSTADTLKDAGYQIVSGPSDVKYAIWDTQSQPWVTDDGSSETLTLDSAVTDYLETAKKLYDGGYTNNTTLWDSSWAADMSDDSTVFCFFGCPWFIGSMQGNGATDGNWGAVVGPTSYHWGGTYVTVGKDTNNPELCAFLLYELTCDPDIGVAITNQTGDCVNNKEANDRLVNGELADDNAAAAFLGGQNPITVWAASAEGLDLSNVTYNDATIKSFIDDASTAYNAGTYSSVDDAIAYIQDQAASVLGISAE